MNEIFNELNKGNADIVAANLTVTEDRIKKVMDQRRADLALILENLSEDLNISAILRTAESFGVGRICIVHPRGVLTKLH